MKTSIVLARTYLLMGLCVAKATADGSGAQAHDFDAGIAPILARPVSTAIPGRSQGKARPVQECHGDARRQTRAGDRGGQAG